MASCNIFAMSSLTLEFSFVARDNNNNKKKSFTDFSGSIMQLRYFLGIDFFHVCSLGASFFKSNVGSLWEWHGKGSAESVLRSITGLSRNWDSVTFMVISHVSTLYGNIWSSSNETGWSKEVSIETMTCNRRLFLN